MFPMFSLDWSGQLVLPRVSSLIIHQGSNMVGRRRVYTTEDRREVPADPSNSDQNTKLDVLY